MPLKASSCLFAYRLDRSGRKPRLGMTDKQFQKAVNHKNSFLTSYSRKERPRPFLHILPGGQKAHKPLGVFFAVHFHHTTRDITKLSQPPENQDQHRRTNTQSTPQPWACSPPSSASSSWPCPSRPSPAHPFTAPTLPACSG